MQSRLRFLVFAFLVLFPSLLKAQVSSATVTGSIQDPGHSVLPHAKIVATEQATGVSVSAETNDRGEYTLPLLKPGRYNLLVQVAGFQRYEQRDLALSSGDHPTIDITLALGEATQTVEVQATVPLLGTADASLGQVVPAKLVEELPLNGRTPMSFAQYTVGVIATTNPVGVHAYDNSAVSAFSVGGLPNKNAEILMDGSPDNASDNAIAYSPPVDATSEVRIQVFESDASYGHAGGAVANQVTKSGTNRYHGSLSEYNQVSALNANSYFALRSNSPKPVYRYNQFAGTFGGPIRIPKLFDGRDKLFFFGAYEGIRTSGNGNAFLTVPTDAERTGDFSALLALGTTRSTDVECTVNGTKILATPYNSNAIFNPSTATVSKVCPGVIERQPFANNRITTPLNPVAVAALQYFPKANVAGNALGQGNYFSTSSASDMFDNHFGRLDYNLSARHRLYLTARHSERDQRVAQFFGAANPAYGDFLQRINFGGSVGDVITLTPSLLAEVRLNYTRFEQNSITNGDGFNAASLGLPALQSNHLIFPRFFFNTVNSLGSTTMTPGTAPFDSYGIFVDVLKTTGLHSIKFGVDTRRFQKGNFVFGDSSGRYSFDNSYVKNFSTNSFVPPVGYDIAAFLLGLPTSASYDLNAHSVGQQSYLGLFVQDDWRARPDLTINVGLRFDKDFPPFERNGRAVNGFDATSANPISAAAMAAYAKNPIPQISAANFKVNGGLTFASSTSRNFSNFTSNMFSPRIGLAYSPKQLGGNSVIRAGFGIFVIPIFPFNNAINQSGFSQTTQSPTTTNNFLTANATLSNPFPNGLVQPAGSSGGLSTFAGQSLTILSPTIRNGYSERWHLGFQRQLPGNWLAEAFYVGSTGRRLPINQPLNFLQPQFLTNASNPALNASTANPFAGLLPNGGGLNGGTTSIAQLLNVYPEFGSITLQNAANGGSIYHALDLHFEHRTSKGLTLIANYQWSKLLEAVTYLNNFDPRPEYRISTFDRPHHAVIALSYNLPYGRGREYGARIPRYVDLALGGWNVASSYFFQTGAVNVLGNVTPTGAPLNYNRREATEFGTNAALTLPSFNINAFNNSVSATGTPVAGNGLAQPTNNIRIYPSSFSNFRSDAYNEWDASILKNFNFTDSAFFQFRLEAFNVNNRPVFNGPNLSPTSSQFGQITSTANSPRTLQLGGRIVF